MKSKTFFCTLILATAFLFCNYNAKAENKPQYSDTTCCAPDSLTVISTNYPEFCVSWHIPSDSSCKKIQGFVIQWKLLLSNNWDSEFITYTSGSYINFCDSVDICGVYQWRVRTKCTDSTYSDWVWGNKFGFDCGGRSSTSSLSISPNPASESITINMKDLNPGKLKISVINMNGRNVFNKMVYTHSGHLNERISVAGWQRGIYFVGIFEDGVLINRASFIKE